MYYAISMKILGQTHMWYTQHRRSNFLEIFQFLWVFLFLFLFFIFYTLKNKTCKVRSTKKYIGKLEKETCYKPKAMTQEDYVCHDAWTYDPKHQKN